MGTRGGGEECNSRFCACNISVDSTSPGRLGVVPTRMSDYRRRTIIALVVVKIFCWNGTVTWIPEGNERRGREGGLERRRG